MGRSVHALVFLFLLFVCSETMTASSKYMSDEELGLSLAVAKKLKHDHHRHSGFSEAECPDACQYRCSKTQYKKPCLFFCQKCCFKCKCVPPGTYAHKDACPCYNNWKTKEGGPKCP